MRGYSGKIALLGLFFIILFIICLSSMASAQPIKIPRVKLEWDEKEDSRENVSKSLQILILLTVLSLAPAILVMMTSFTRIVIVLSFLRHALGTQQIPPTQVLISFALFLTFFTMLPTFSKINKDAIKPYTKGQLAQKKALKKAEGFVRNFMFRQTREKDLELFIYASGAGRPRRKADVSTMVLIPSFVLSERRTAFIMGFTLFSTFLVIHMVVGSILMLF